MLKTAQAAGGTGHGKGDLTMEDLLDTAVAKGDLKAYDASESSYGKYLNSVTSKDGAKAGRLEQRRLFSRPILVPVRQRRLCELFVRPGQACRREFLPILLGFVFFGDRSVRLESVLREESCRPGEGRRWLADFRGCDPDGSPQGARPTTMRGRRRTRRGSTSSMHSTRCSRRPKPTAAPGMRRRISRWRTS